MPPHPHAFVLSAPSPAPRAALSLSAVWRALVGAVQRSRADGTGSGPNVWAGGALADLDERMLKDIGVAELQAARAAMRCYEDLRTRIDGGLR
jgi:hypothetical protein